MAHNLIGKKFGRLLVLEKTERRLKHGKVVWKCVCDCGNIVYPITNSLTRGITQSCGCLQKEKASENRRISFKEASFNNLFAKYRQNARLRGYTFNLTKEQFKDLTSQDCFYCCQEPKTENKGLTFGNYIYNGIDRMDNSKGYEIDNCVPCCETCNKAKRTMSQNEFLDWIERIYNSFYLAKRGDIYGYQDSR